MVSALVRVLGQQPAASRARTARLLSSVAPALVPSRKRRAFLPSRAARSAPEPALTPSLVHQNWAQLRPMSTLHPGQAGGSEHFYISCKPKSAAVSKGPEVQNTGPNRPEGQLRPQTPTWTSSQKTPSDSPTAHVGRRWQPGPPPLPQPAISTQGSWGPLNRRERKPVCPPPWCCPRLLPGE